MSDHSLTSFFKDCARRARNILKKTEPDDIAAHCYKEANDLGMITNDWLIHLAMRAIKDMVTIRASPKRTEFNQLRLFTDYEDIVFDLRHDDGVVGLADAAPVRQAVAEHAALLESVAARNQARFLRLTLACPGDTARRVEQRAVAKRDDLRDA